MTKRKFRILFSIYHEDVDSGIIEIDQKVIDQVDAEWRSQFYPNLTTPEKIAAHIGFNLMRHPNWNLDDLDGWGNLENNLVNVLEYPNLDHWDVEAEEIE